MGKVRKKSKQFKHINSARLENFESLSSSISSLESKIAKLINVLEKIDRASAFEQSIRNRAKNEQELGLTEQRSEQSLSSYRKSSKGFNGTTMQKVMGRNRELLTLLINEGFHTYAEISKKMDISESRARAYVTELKKNFNIPIKQIRDSEGYKIGIDISFVDRILSAAKVE